jgi:hypothetical protein
MDGSTIFTLASDVAMLIAPVINVMMQTIANGTPELPSPL